MVIFGSSFLVLILNLMDFVDNSKGRLSEYNED
jgi:hypothetical protein